MQSVEHITSKRALKRIMANVKQFVGDSLLSLVELIL